MRLRLSERGIKSEPCSLDKSVLGGTEPLRPTCTGRLGSVLPHGGGWGPVSATGLQKPAVPQSRPPVDVIADPGVINQESG